MQTPSNYCITPSQLDEFTRMTLCDDEERARRYEKSLIDQINRVPKQWREVPADRGTAFNELVDYLSHKHHPLPEDMQMEQHTLSDGTAVFDVKYRDFRFIFAAEDVLNFAKQFNGSLEQYLCEAHIQTSYGKVLLYGYMDEWVGDKIYDIKTTTRYEFGKYELGWQRYVYPYCVVKSGLVSSVSAFEYAIYTLKTRKIDDLDVLFGTWYRETYTINMDDITDALHSVCESFIEWLETRRNLITDRKIFGKMNPPDYAGEPIDINKI